jgi:hypothetical protein
LRIEQNSEETKIVGLVTIYDKSEYENISTGEIIDLISQIDNEIEEIDNK